MSDELDLSLELRCGSCSLFVEDYADKKATYGHCGRKPRIGSALDRDYKCEDYRVRPDYRRAIEERDGTGAAAAPTPAPTTTAFARAAESATSESSAPSSPSRPASEPSVVRVVRARSGDGNDESARGALPDRNEIRAIVADAIDDLLGLSELRLGDRWLGGQLILRPANPSLQDKEMELEKFWHKIVMVREQLRNLERAVNGNESLSEADKVQLQQYVTRCYGSLTTFNVLFKDKEHQFRGAKKG